LHATREELPILFGEDPAAIRGADWGALRAMVVSLPAGADVASLLKGLPHDMCSCPHWGYVVKGRMRIVYADGGGEVLRAGDLFHIPAGHVPVVEEDVEFVEISPPADAEAVMDALRRNAAAGTA
jgi:quercetin dioxygenase-like cupin family protein